MPVSLSSLRVEATGSVEQTHRRLGDSSTAVERLARSIDPAYNASQRLATGQQTLQRALDTGRISADRYSELLGLLNQRYAPTGEAGATSGRVMVNAFGLNRQGLQELQAEVSTTFRHWRPAWRDGARRVCAGRRRLVPHNSCLGQNLTLGTCRLRPESTPSRPLPQVPSVGF